MNLCKDCIHHVKKVGFDRCRAFVDPITGDAGALCDVERDGAGLKTGCGREGRKFEQKPIKVFKWKFWE